MEAKQLAKTTNSLMQPRQLEIGAQTLYATTALATSDDYPDPSPHHHSLGSTKNHRFHLESLERGTTKAAVQATLTSQPPATGDVKLRLEAPLAPASPALLEIKLPQLRLHSMLSVVIYSLNELDCPSA